MQNHLFKGRAGTEQIFLQCGYPGRYSYALESLAGIECVVTESLKTSRKIQSLQFRAMCKDRLSHTGEISSVMIVLSFTYLMTIDWILTLIIFACVPILIVVTMHYRKAMKSAFDDRRKSNATINASVESSITGIRVTKAYTNSEKEIEKFARGDEEFVDASARA